MESHIHRSFNLFVLSWVGPLVLLPSLSQQRYVSVQRGAIFIRLQEFPSMLLEGRFYACSDSGI